MFIGLIVMLSDRVKELADPSHRSAAPCLPVRSLRDRFGDKEQVESRGSGDRGVYSRKNVSPVVSGRRYSAHR